MRSLVQSRWLDGEDAVKGLRAASIFFLVMGKGSKTATESANCGYVSTST